MGAQWWERHTSAILRREEDIADIFWDIGVKKNSARALGLMVRDIDLTSRDIKRVVDLRQPEVSIAITDLENVIGQKYPSEYGEQRAAS